MDASKIPQASSPSILPPSLPNMPNNGTSTLLSDNQTTIATPVQSVEHYAEPLMKMISEFRLEDIPGEIARLKTLGFFNWKDMRPLPAPSFGDETFQRHAIHYLSSLPPKLIAESSALFAVKCLLEESQDKDNTKTILDMRDKFGLTALHLAAANLDSDFVKLLLDRGANVAIQEQNGFTPLHYAVNGNPNGDSVALCLIEKSRAAVSTKANNGQTALHIAIANHRLEVVRRLLPLFEPSDLHAYNENLISYLDHARAIAAKQRKSTPGPSNEEDQTADSKTANKVVQEVFKACRASRSGNEDSQKPGVISALTAHLYTARIQLAAVTLPNTLTPTVRPTTFAHTTCEKPVCEVLHGSEAWLAELRKRQSAPAPEWLASWMHLPSHDVRGLCSTWLGHD